MISQILICSFRYLAFGFGSGIFIWIAIIGQAWMHAMQVMQPSGCQVLFCPSTVKQFFGHTFVQISHPIHFSVIRYKFEYACSNFFAIFVRYTW